MMDRRNERPLAPWEQEQAAAALAELKQEQVVQARSPSAEDDALERTEAVALKAADQHLLIQQVDRMIADKRSDLARMQRLSGPGGKVNARGVALSELGKPAAIIVLLLTIIAIGFALNWMAGKIKLTIDNLPPPAAEPAAQDSE
jgi:hypothetical protein